MARLVVIALLVGLAGAASAERRARGPEVRPVALLPRIVNKPNPRPFVPRWKKKWRPRHALPEGRPGRQVAEYLGTLAIAVAAELASQ